MGVSLRVIRTKFISEFGLSASGSGNYTHNYISELDQSKKDLSRNASGRVAPGGMF